MSLRQCLVSLGALMVLGGCSQGGGPANGSPTSLLTLPAATATSIASPASGPPASAGISGSFPVDTTGRKLAMACSGAGSPTVFLETGGGGLDELTDSKLVRAIETETRVCLYNRAGDPPSDPAPDRKREAEDIAADFHSLVRAAGVQPPFVLFGRSFGGMIVTFYAATYPDDVAGVVVFDSPAPSATMTEADFPEGVWDAPENTYHLDVLYGFENRFGKTPVHFAAPLIVISTTAGESRPEDHYWLQTSDHARQVVLTGGMEVIDEQAPAVAALVLSLVRTARG